jgi:hypothetical protein
MGGSLWVMMDRKAIKKVIMHAWDPKHCYEITWTITVCMTFKWSSQRTKALYEDQTLTTQMRQTQYPLSHEILAIHTFKYAET